MLDQRGKRVQQFELGKSGFERQPDPLVLPRGSFGRCILEGGDAVYVGGGTQKAPEALWMIGDRGLAPVALPAGVGWAGESIDHMYRHGEHLVAVDDLMWYEQLEDCPEVPRAVDVRWTEVRHQGEVAAEDVQRQETVAAVVAVKKRPSTMEDWRAMSLRADRRQVQLAPAAGRRGTRAATRIWPDASYPLLRCAPIQ